MHQHVHCKPRKINNVQVTSYVTGTIVQRTLGSTYQVTSDQPLLSTLELAGQTQKSWYLQRWYEKYVVNSEGVTCMASPEIVAQEATEEAEGSQGLSGTELERMKQLVHECPKDYRRLTAFMFFGNEQKQDKLWCQQHKVAESERQKALKIEWEQLGLVTQKVSQSWQLLGCERWDAEV